MKKDDLFDKDIDDMTDEERERYAEFLDSGNMLQGAVQAPEFRPDNNILNMQMVYGPPNAPSMNMGSFMVNSPILPPEMTGKWKDETHWICSCGAENTARFCAECGMPAPPKPWTCECGAVCTGKFCGECGKPRNDN